MQKQTPETASPSLLRADQLLADMRRLMDLIAWNEKAANAALARVTEAYNKELAPLKWALDQQAKDLLALMKSERKIIFDGTDLVRLEHGSLLYSLEPHVTIPRGALEKCKALGFQDAINVVESLDRGAVEAWPDEKLLQIGAERKPKPAYNYEVL